MSPRDAYVAGRDDYKKGDWINARKYFDAAVAGGYKPHLFEDSPQTYLARMDRKEQEDAAKNAALAAKNPPAASTPPQAVAVVRQCRFRCRRRRQQRHRKRFNLHRFHPLRRL